MLVQQSFGKVKFPFFSLTSSTVIWTLRQSPENLRVAFWAQSWVQISGRFQKNLGLAFSGLHIEANSCLQTLNPPTMGPPDPGPPDMTWSHSGGGGSTFTLTKRTYWNTKFSVADSAPLLALRINLKPVEQICRSCVCTAATETQWIHSSSRSTTEHRDTSLISEIAQFCASTRGNRFCSLRVAD